jgi:chloramphenicol-sensitive protein RarD
MGVAAYAMWGLFPLYWRLLEPAGAVEILAHRVCWSLVTMVVLTVALRRTPYLRAIVRDRRVVVLLVVASIVIAFNWGGFIYGVNQDRVVEVSLGYFINPLVTVLLGVFVLGERLRPLQWAAIGIAGIAVVILTVDYGHPPWIALLLAGSFGTYGLAKKKANVEAVESLTFETLLLAPLALAYLWWLSATGDSNFANHGAGHAFLLATTGLVTAVPLICFGAAAIRIPMTTLGLLQYLAPTIQFVLGLVVFNEQMTGVKWVGFTLVWLALAIFTAEALRHRRRQLRLIVEASAV